MVNNYEKILNLLDFSDPDKFYFCQIIKRKKEHPELGRNSYVVKTYYIDSKEKFDKYRDEMICLANFHNAGVYIDVNRRSFKQLAYQNLKKITDQIISGDYKSVKDSYNSVCGIHKISEDKLWVVDIDCPEPKLCDLDLIEIMIKEINKLDPVEYKVMALIPTKNGYHLLSKPFNSLEFKKLYPDIDIHKNNPTILYIP